jgi:hypothetical protein
MRNQCPNDETLADYLEGRLSGSQQARIESHLATCSNCREQVGIYLKLVYPDMSEQFSTAPKHVTDSAVDLVAGLAKDQRSRPRFEGVRRWAAKKIALLEQLAPSNGLRPVAVRSADTVVSERRISRKKKFKELNVTIEIERSSGDLALIRVVAAEQPTPDHPIRVTLLKSDREITSMMLEDASLVFEDIAFGAYALVFIRSGAVIGKYCFEITADTDDTIR